MTRLRGIFHFRVRDLLVADDLLGTEHRVVEDDFEITIRLPSEKSAEVTTSRDEKPSAEEIERLFPGCLPAELISAGAATSMILGFGPHDPGFSTLTLLRAEVDFDGDLQAADYIDRPHEGPFVEDPAEIMLQAARLKGEEVVNALVALVRTQVRQSWLGLEGELVEGVGAGTLVDLDAFTTVPRSISLGPANLVIQRVRSDQILDSASAEELITKVHSGQKSDLAESLLLDALFVVQHSDPNASLSALLLAAAAAEFRIKEVLRRVARGSTLQMLDLLLANPRDWSLAAGALWDRPCKVILGSSLREEDRELWKCLEELIQRRNGLAHRGKIPSPEEIAEDVKTAVRLFRWLDQAESADARADATTPGE